MDEKQQVKASLKSMFYAFGTFCVILLIGQWYATQQVAAQCDYNPVLGAYFAVGNTKIYFPFMYYFWSHDPDISTAIPDIIKTYNPMYLLAIGVSFLVFYFMKKSLHVQTEHGSASFATQQDIIDSGLGEMREIEDPKQVLKNQFWKDVFNLDDSFFMINNLPESSAEERSIKQKRWQHYWSYIKKNRPKDTAEQLQWDYEHNLAAYRAYGKSLEDENEKEKILARIEAIMAERNVLASEEERELFDIQHDLQKWQKAANDYKDAGMKQKIWQVTVEFILKERPKGSKEQQSWDARHNIDRIMQKLHDILKDLSDYEKEHRPKPETPEEIRRFAISRHPRPTEKQIQWDAHHNLRETLAALKNDKKINDSIRQDKIKEIQEYIKENEPEKGTEEYLMWWRRHTLKESKKKTESQLSRWEKFISKNCPKPKKVKKPKTSGVVVGINPFTHKLMLHDGVEHILLMAPTRSGKGVCTIVPTGLIWKHSIFFFDPKGELWGLTSGYRKYVLKQKVLKFQPLCKDGSAARWNPLAEVNYRSFEELSDVQSIVSVMVRPDGEQKGGDSFWPDSAAALLNGVILHLLYQHDKENLPLPCPTDIMSFLSSPDKTTEELFTDMRDYPHISPEEFLEVPILDEKGNEILDKNGIVKRRKNPLKEIYGEYIKDFRVFTEELGVTVRSLDEIRTIIQYKIDHGEKIIWESTTEGLPSGTPYHLLLTHPKVAEAASNMLNGADQTRASIMQTAQTALAIYQDPVVQTNMAVSDFAIRDLLDPKQEVSLYLVMEVKDIAAVKPIARLFLQMLCAKLIQDMKFGKEAKNLKKQRLLLMLDEFPQLGNMKCIELALAICAGYGIKMCIVCQDVNQLNKEYTKDNSIGSNCHLHIYFTPNIDSGGATAESISKQLGKKTIKTVSHSDGGGFFKGSDSTSSTGRELMTPDEVSHMSSEKELVFVAGHKPILGDKLRYYQHSWLLKRTQIEKPAASDTVTRIVDYETLAKIRAAEIASKEKDRMRVLEDKAQKEGITLSQYLKHKEEMREKHEKEVIWQFVGKTNDTKQSEASVAESNDWTSPASASDRKGREDQKTLNHSNHSAESSDSKIQRFLNARERRHARTIENTQSNPLGTLPGKDKELNEEVLIALYKNDAGTKKED